MTAFYQKPVNLWLQSTGGLPTGGRECMSGGEHGDINTCRGQVRVMIEETGEGLMRDLGGSLQGLSSNFESMECNGQQ
eukprot:1161691-Pelagomonas_calceolata.AAC.11